MARTASRSSQESGLDVSIIVYDLYQQSRLGITGSITKLADDGNWTTRQITQRRCGITGGPGRPLG